MWRATSCVGVGLVLMIGAPARAQRAVYYTTPPTVTPMQFPTPGDLARGLFGRFTTPTPTRTMPLPRIEWTATDTTGSSQRICTMPVAAPDSARLERMPVAVPDSARITRMPVIKPGCTNPLRR